jgi:hypothetical protein
LAAALNEARRQRCSVAVAKLDRLSRRCPFHQRPDGSPGALCGR